MPAKSAQLNHSLCQLGFHDFRLLNRITAFFSSASNYLSQCAQNVACHKLTELQISKSLILLGQNQLLYWGCSCHKICTYTGPKVFEIPKNVLDFIMISSSDCQEFLAVLTYSWTHLFVWGHWCCLVASKITRNHVVLSKCTTNREGPLPFCIDGEGVLCLRWVDHSHQGDEMVSSEDPCFVICGNCILESFDHECVMY